MKTKNKILVVAENTLFIDMNQLGMIQEKIVSTVLESPSTNTS